MNEEKKTRSHPFNFRNEKTYSVSDPLLVIQIYHTKVFRDNRYQFGNKTQFYLAE